MRKTGAGDGAKGTGPMEIVRLGYQSRAVDGLIARDVQRIMSVSEARNRAIGVTGVLTYHDHRFFQILEGEATDIAALYQHIRLDARHCDVTTVFHEEDTVRLFKDWGMHLCDAARRPPLRKALDALGTLHARPADLHSRIIKLKAFLQAHYRSEALYCVTARVPGIKTAGARF